jgi:hypothetical protein
MVQVAVSTWGKLLIIALLCAAAFSCKKQAPAAGSSAPANPAAATMAGSTSPAGAAAQTSTPSPTTITLARDQQAQTAVAKPSLNAVQLLALDAGKRTLPEDFAIGPLADVRDSAAAEDGAIDLADRFLAALVAGKVDRSLLAPDAEARVSDSLSYGLARAHAPIAFRIGAPRRREGGEITAAVRLFSSVGTSEGEIYLAESASQWLVADLQLNMAELAVARAKPKERYFPSAYRWLLED